ncbi:MAG: hypothetical protein JWQ38_118 [Flavipsychrobacter sp.]|nr:hypothetical protein [Flavipsychrobacter sp.]
MVIAISFFILAGWLLFGYHSLLPGKKYSISRRSKKILILSSAITTLLFVHDYIYDKPSTTYTLTETLVELILIGTLYIVIIFFLILAINSIANAMSNSR